MLASHLKSRTERAGLRKKFITHLMHSWFHLQRNNERFPSVRRPVVTVEKKGNDPSHWKIFGENGMTSDIFLSVFRFCWNACNINVPFCFLGDFGGKWNDPSNCIFEKLLLFHLPENYHRVFHTNFIRWNKISCRWIDFDKFSVLRVYR